MEQKYEIRYIINFVKIKAYWSINLLGIRSKGISGIHKNNATGRQ